MGPEQRQERPCHQGPPLPSSALPSGSSIIQQWDETSTKESYRGPKQSMWVRIIQATTQHKFNKEKKPSYTKTKNSQLYKHWDGNSWSAEIKGAWESTSHHPISWLLLPHRGPWASQGSLLQSCADDLVPAKIGVLLISAGDALRLQLADINSTGSTGVEEISPLGQVTCIPCSVSKQKRLHFPESAPAGSFSQVNSYHFIAGCSVAMCSHPTTAFKGARLK